MSTNRDEFSAAVKKQLAERVGYRCSNPCCKCLTIAAQKGGEGSVNVGEAAHIYAAAPGGKRYNADMASEERKSFENGIWLCRKHAALIDRDEKYFTVEMLQNWKCSAEEDASNQLLGVQGKASGCRYYMGLFYRDLQECVKWMTPMKMRRGTILDPTCFPIQADWENRIRDNVDALGIEIAITLTTILREIEEFKDIMRNEKARTGLKRIADANSVMYCQCQDLFLKRMDTYLTEEFMSAIDFFVNS